MNLKNKLICIASAFCILGSITCFSAFAADFITQPSLDEEQPVAEAPAVTVDPGYTEQPAVDPAPSPDPVVPEQPAPDPVYVEPTEPQTYNPVDSQTYDPGVTASVEPTVPTDPDPGVYTDPNAGQPTYSATYNELISEGNFPQPTYSATEPLYDGTTAYVDNTQQYNQYIYNTYQAEYDDNYIYVPEYEEPVESMISTTSKVIDTDELTNDDWDSIMLDLSNGTIDSKGAQTFAFIKENEEEGDTDMMWLVYLGTVLIIAAILMIIFVIVSTIKENTKVEYFYA